MKLFEIVLESIQPLLNTLVPTFTGLLGLYIGVKLTERSQHSLEKMKQHHQLSMSAIDKRLEVHQGCIFKMVETCQPYIRCKPWRNEWRLRKIYC